MGHICTADGARDNVKYFEVVGGEWLAVADAAVRLRV